MNYVVYKCRGYLNYDDTDYEYFYEKTDALKFLENNKQYELKENLSNSQSVYCILKNLHQMVKKEDLSGIDIIHSFGKYIGKSIHYYCERRSKLQYGIINNIYFDKLMLTYNDYVYMSPLGGDQDYNKLEISNVTEGGVNVFDFKYYDEFKIGKIEDYIGLRERNYKDIQRKIKPSFIYFIKSNFDNSIKIGYSTNI